MKTTLYVVGIVILLGSIGACSLSLNRQTVAEARGDFIGTARAENESQSGGFIVAAICIGAAAIIGAIERQKSGQ